MKVPFTVNNHNSSKSIDCTAVTVAGRNPTTGSPYEPKSVLELRGSPSPVKDQKQTLKSNSTDELEDDHALINHHLEDWDSLMRELGLNDDSSPPLSKPVISHHDGAADGTHLSQNHYSNMPEFPPVSTFDSIQFVPTDFGLATDISVYPSAPLNHVAGDLHAGNWSVGFDYVDELIRLAECFDTNSLQLGHVILARLNQRLSSPLGKPLQRAAFFFKEALQSLLTGSTPITRPASTSEIIQTIKAQKTFSTISPITMFSSFTANQAMLDAFDGCIHVHIIDFNIGLGGHWASFMREFADKADSSTAVLRISALVPEDYAMESRLVRDILTQFARELNIRFDIDFILIRTFEYLSFKSMKFTAGEKVAILLSPAIFRHIGTGLLNDIRQVSPHVVVYIDDEGQMASGTSSYRQNMIDGLEFYSTLLESLEAENINGCGSEWLKRIETFVIFPKILETIEVTGLRVVPPREALVAAGLRQVGLGQFAEFQAECLLRRLQVRGFNIIKRQAEMLLCWHDRPLVLTSAWRF